MVQYQPEEYLHGAATYTAQHYWKLKNPDLLEASRLRDRIENSVSLEGRRWTRARLKKMHDRLECGLLLYENCSTEELQSYCLARGIKMATKLSSDSEQLMRALERADNGVVFDKFLDLPPELRVRIYKHHVAFFAIGPSLSPPPIAYTSKFVRHETIPVFFMYRSFSCDDVNQPCSWSRTIPPRPRELEFRHRDAEFWKHAPLAFLHSVRQFELTSPIVAGGGSYVTWTVDLTSRYREERVKFDNSQTYCRDTDHALLLQVSAVVIEKLSEVIDGVVAREPVRFERGDANAILTAIAVSP